MFASLAVIYAETGIARPPLGCTMPQPVAKQAAFDLALDSMGNVASVANWLGVAGLVALAVGVAVVPSGRRLPLLALLVPVLLVIFVVYGLGRICGQPQTGAPVEAVQPGDPDVSERAMKEFAVIGGPGALLGVVTGYLVRPARLFVPLLVGIAVVAAVGAWGTTTSGENDGGCSRGSSPSSSSSASWSESS
jgi:uncharacterized membrane protein (Fun14 family)